MRIISGKFRRRRLLALPKGATTRPLPDLVREALFNLLRGHTEGQTVIDVFAGSGCFGLEALSRGAEHAVFVERDRKVVGVLEQNLDTLGITDQARILVLDATSPLLPARLPERAHLIFLDPPYPMTRSPEEWEQLRTLGARMAERLTDDGYLILRTPHPHAFEGLPGSEPEISIDGAIGPERHEYGGTALNLYMRTATDPET